MLALVILLIGFALCAGLLLAMPTVAEGLIGLFPGTAQDNAAAIDTLVSLSFFGGLILIAMVGGALSGFNAARLGSRPLANLSLGLLVGAVGVGAAAGYAWLAGSLSQGAHGGASALLLWGSAVVLLETAAEEIYFRGWLQRVIAERWGKAAALLLGALGFAGLHVVGGARDPVSIANLFLGGLLFGLLAFRAGGIAAAVAAHFAWNWIEQIVLGLAPNPGVGSFGALVDLDLAGAAIWGGSDDGLNASAAMSLTLLALVVPLVLLARGDASARRREPGRYAPARP